jgi:hypothetical protein
MPLGAREFRAPGGRIRTENTSSSSSLGRIAGSGDDGDSYRHYQIFICIMPGAAGDCLDFAPISDGKQSEASMAMVTKTALLSLGVVAGLAFAAQAQTSGLASLPPNPSVAPPAAASPVAPSAAMPGPSPGGSNAPTGSTQATVTPSENYVGPTPGGGNGPVPPRFEKSADWDNNTALHPYTSNMGPRPN